MTAPAMTPSAPTSGAGADAVRPDRRRGIPWGLVAALVAAAALVVLAPTHQRPQTPAGRVRPAVAWPKAQLADIPGAMPDGPAYQPVFFLDARVSVGTAPTPDGTRQRLVWRGADGSIRLLRSLPYDQNPQFTAFTASGDELAWAEQGEGGPTRMWAVNVRTGAAPRELTADTGNVIFYDSQYDMVVADGRLHWAAATPDGQDTQIRSVALTGGPVDVRTQPGTWALTAWPWLVNGVAEQIGSTRLRNLNTRDEVTVASSAAGLTSCSPTWCRVLVMSSGSLVRIDLVHPDGSDRRRVAGGAAAAAITDVAPLDRFEILAEPDPNFDLTGTQRLLVYDLSTKGTVDVGAGVNAAVYRGGVLWWSTGGQDKTVWHTLDLRTA